MKKKDDQSLPGDYIISLFTLAEEYKDAALMLNKDIVKSFLERRPVLFPVAFLAAHAAELYLKTLIIAHEKPSPSKKTLKKLRGDIEIRHDLEKLLDELVKTCSEAEKLREVVAILNKYSGIKMRYIELTEPNPDVIGTDEIFKVKDISKFTKDGLVEIGWVDKQFRS